MQEGRLPAGWKESHVTPIYKAGAKSQASNYRPVSLTSVVCKVMETLIRQRLMEHLKENAILNDCQHGFVAGRSCTTQLFKIIDAWTRVVDAGGCVDVAYLDYRKAFDTVPHQRLLRKLQAYGVRGQTLEWIKDFLVGRRQRVSVDGELSAWAWVLSGIPQGSVLGPVLFILYVNDLPDVVHSLVQMFADDTKLFREIGGETDSVELQADLDNLILWSIKWQMSFNTAKCKIMHLGKNNPRTGYTMGVGEARRELAVVKEEKDLGVTFQETLSFVSHCDRIVSKANRILGLIRAGFEYIDRDTMSLLFKGLVRPHLEYAVVIWSPLHLKDRRRLEAVQKRATRMVPGMKDLEYCDRLEKMKLPSLRFRRLRGDMITVYRILHEDFDVDMTELLPRDMGVRTRGHSLKLLKQRCMTDLRKHCFPCRVVDEWNSLPEDVVVARNVNIFKGMLDRHWSSRWYEVD